MNMFGPSGFLPTMASADFLQLTFFERKIPITGFKVLGLFHLSSAGSPGVRHLAFTSWPPDLPLQLRTSFGLRYICALSRLGGLIIRFLSISSKF